MNRTKLVLGAVILGSTLLAGCSTNAKLAQLSSKVDGIESQVNQLQSDVRSVASVAEAANVNANDAKARCSNMPHHYRK